MVKKKKLKVEVEWKLLQRIAEYYEFPTAIFLGSNDIFKRKSKTRNKSLRKKMDEFEKKLIKLVDEYFH